MDKGMRGNIPIGDQVKITLEIKPGTGCSSAWRRLWQRLSSPVPGSTPGRENSNEQSADVEQKAEAAGQGESTGTE